ncbi:MAG: hypothetical protein ACKVS7_04885 [Gemmatimonadaceae bacterium]
MPSYHLAQNIAQANAPAAPQAPVIPPLPGRAGGSTGGASAPAPAQGGSGGGGAEAPASVQPGSPTTERVLEQIANDALRDATTSEGVPWDPNVIPPEVVPIVGMSLAMVVTIFIGWPIARAIARRMDSRALAGTVQAKELQPQIRQLQESIDAMAIELERLGEAQRYQTKLLAERSEVKRN